MIDTIRMKNDLLFRANHVCNALYCKAAHGLNGTNGWDEEGIIPGSMCDNCIFGDDPQDCDYSALFDDAAKVMGELINEIKRLNYLLNEQENASKRNPVIVCPQCGEQKVI